MLINRTLGVGNTVAEPAPPANKCTVKASRYDGTLPWEAYQVKFHLAALANNWKPEEQAGQLAAALEGKVLQALLHLDPEEPCDFHALATALQHRFGKVEPVVGLRHRLATQKRTSGEKLGVLTADTMYLARWGYPGLPPDTKIKISYKHFYLEPPKAVILTTCYNTCFYCQYNLQYANYIYIQASLLSLPPSLKQYIFE
ncbi:UNVERIFIED_CONTAM: hypothetical protein FKN15_004273 [Acipenser sinensis]